MYLYSKTCCWKFEDLCWNYLRFRAKINPKRVCEMSQLHIKGFFFFFFVLGNISFSSKLFIFFLISTYVFHLTEKFLIAAFVQAESSLWSCIEGLFIHYKLLKGPNLAWGIWLLCFLASSYHAVYIKLLFYSWMSFVPLSLFFCNLHYPNSLIAFRIFYLFVCVKFG